MGAGTALLVEHVGIAGLPRILDGVPVSERLTKLFAFAANSDPSGVADISKSTVFNDYIARAEKEYETLSATCTSCPTITCSRIRTARVSAIRSTSRGHLTVARAPIKSPL